VGWSGSLIRGRNANLQSEKWREGGGGGTLSACEGSAQGRGQKKKGAGIARNVLKKRKKKKDQKKSKLGSEKTRRGFRTGNGVAEGDKE